ncbi:MAG: hypothetical protein M3426_03535 [Actinomycetota bacterium]|nr:hypothetical protein [Actinomycetota bacterium]
MTKHGGKDPRVEPGSARRLTRRDFLKVGGAMVGASCVSFPLACAGRWGTFPDAGSGGATLRGPAGLWYEDNNMGTAGGMPPDFKEKFYRPDLWAGAREAIDVYYVRATTLLNPENGLDDSFLEKNFVPVLEESGVEIALDAVEANFLRARPAPADERIEREISLVEKLGAMGGRVGYVALQSVLSKPLREKGRVVEYPMQQRIEDVVEYAKTARERLPDVEIGIIDALPTKGLDYRDPYGRLAAALSEEDPELKFVHLDCPYEHPQEGARITWEGVKEVESFVKTDIGARFDFICTSRTGGEASDEAWNDNVLDAPRQYASVGGSPDEYVVMSWFPHPGSTIPEAVGPGRFSDTKTVLSFARELET